MPDLTLPALVLALLLVLAATLTLARPLTRHRRTRYGPVTAPRRDLHEPGRPCGATTGDTVTHPGSPYVTCAPCRATRTTAA